MDYLIIGNGPAGTAAAGKIRSLDKNSNITIFSYENYLYYARPRLHEIIEGKSTIEQIIVNKLKWYEDNNIKININTKIDKIDRSKKTIYSKNNEYKYDKLLLATGADASLINIKGIENKDILTLRTIDDALTIKEKIKDKKEIIIIGGGLLGLELAYSIIVNKKIVKIIEINQCLLSKQLDINKAKKLQVILEDKGYIFYLCETCQEIIKKDDKFIVITSSGNNIEGQLIIISSGIKPRIKLAKDALIDTDKGIIANKYLQTSDKDIYVAGDCVEYQGQIWGFVKSSIEQGNIAGENMLTNNTKEYYDTYIEPTLKITGIDLKIL